MEPAENIPVDERGFVGGYVPKQLLGHLALYVVHTSVTRSWLIETFFVDFLSKAPSPEVLCNEIAKHYVEKWRIDRKIGISVKWDTFIRKTAKTLNRKKIPENYVTIILGLIARLRPVLVKDS